MDVECAMNVLFSRYAYSYILKMIKEKPQSIHDDVDVETEPI